MENVVNKITVYDIFFTGCAIAYTKKCFSCILYIKKNGLNRTQERKTE